MPGAFEASPGGYGARRLKVALERAGITASRRRICRIMGENGLSSAYSGRAPRGGDRPVQPPSAENVLARSFDGHAPRTHVAADLAYVRAGGSWCCVCLLVDPCDTVNLLFANRANESAPIAPTCFHRFRQRFSTVFGYSAPLLSRGRSFSR